MDCRQDTSMDGRVMKKKRKERSDGFEFLIRGWIRFNKEFIDCIPVVMRAKTAADSYCTYEECNRLWEHWR